MRASLGSGPDLSPTLDHASLTTPGFGNRRNHFYPRPDCQNYSSAAQSRSPHPSRCPPARWHHVNHALVNDGWCWWYRKYAPGDTVLEGLENDAREGRKGLWADLQPVPPWEWRKIKKLGVNRYDSRNPASPMNRGAYDVPLHPVR